MTKTPDEIKKGLECCTVEGEFRDCDNCPYMKDIECQEGTRRDALAYIQQLEAQAPKWINVEERLPEDVGAYVVYGNGRIAFATFYPSVQRWVSNVDSRITHWIRLPEPPKEEEK